MTSLPCPHPTASLGLNLLQNNLLHLQLLHFQPLLPSPPCLLLPALNLVAAAADLALPLLLHPVPLPLYSRQSYTSLLLERTGKTGNNFPPSRTHVLSQVASPSQICQIFIFLFFLFSPGGEVAGGEVPRLNSPLLQPFAYPSTLPDILQSHLISNPTQ